MSSGSSIILGRRRRCRVRKSGTTSQQSPSRLYYVDAFVALSRRRRRRSNLGKKYDDLALVDCLSVTKNDKN
jgi:hypothetical protein